MNTLRKTLKILILIILVFLALTFFLAAAIKFTGFKEEWAFPGLVVILSLSSFLLGFLESGAVGSRGIFVGLASSVFFILLVLFSVGNLLAGSFSREALSIFYLIPVLTGMTGGILGVNRKING